MRTISLFIFLLLTSCSPSVSKNLPGTSANAVTPSCEASAHRGLREAAPDNSLKAISLALNSGVRFVELDVRWGADGELFLFHDRRLQSPTIHSPAHLLGKRPEELTKKERELICLDSSTPCTKLAPLRSALALLKNEDVFYQLDLKGDSFQALPIIRQQADELGVTDQLLIQCYSLEDYFTIRRNFPIFKTLYRVGEAKQFMEAIELQPDIIQGDREWITSELTRAAHNRGIRVLVKTLDPASENAATYQTLFRNGVDIILSDTPTKVQRMVRLVPECGTF